MDHTEIIDKEHEDDLMKKEWDGYLSRRRSKNLDDWPKWKDDWPKWKDKLTGLAISGGGIRSAAFSLGVLQQLASKKLLGLFDYLSTVSGGGYTGGSISYYLNGSRSKDKYNLEENFPYGDSDRINYDPTKELDYLRSHGSYLTPGSGINLLSFIGVVLRAILLNLIIWIPVLILVMAVAQRLIIVGNPDINANTFFGIKASMPWLSDPYAMRGLIYTIIAFLVGSSAFYIMKFFKVSNSLVLAIYKIFRTIIWMLFFFSGWYFSCRVIAGYPVLTEGTLALHQNSSVVSADILHTISESKLISVFVVYDLFKIGILPESFIMFWLFEVPMVFKIFEIGVALFVALYIFLILIYSITTVFQKDQTEYPLRRIHDIMYGIILKWLPVCFVIVLVPYLSWLADLKGGIGSLFVGGTIGLWKLYSKGKEWISIDILAPIAALLVLYGIFITTYSFAAGLESGSDQLITIYIVSFIAVALGYFVDLNHISVGRYYRDRLMEAFMPNDDMVKENKNKPAKEANRFSISSLVPGETEMPKTPYHLINTNAVLVDSKNNKIRKRGGDSFIISPFYTGSRSTGWTNTRQYNKKFTLATAVAISAAAVNPHTGADGRGLTRNPAISFLMALLNIRLGYWASNPNRPEGRLRMNHFWSSWYELSPHAGYNEDSTFIQLSDGGHFDNLGLYELFRRRVRFILVLDGGADKDFQFSDLQNALYRAEQDFEVHLQFNRKFGDIIPQDQDKVKFPEGLKLADTGYVSGRFTYGSDDQQTPGWFFFIKTTMINNMSMRIRGYKGAHPDFPDESTADQFFNEDQFDAYRLLGIDIAKQLTDDIEFTKGLKTYFGK